MLTMFYSLFKSYFQIDLKEMFQIKVVENFNCFECYVNLKMNKLWMKIENVL